MSCCFDWLIFYLLIREVVVSEIDGQACCTLLQWEYIVGSQLTNYSVVIHDYDTRYCQRKCRQDPFCVTFDSYEDNSIVSCYLNKHYHQLLRNGRSTHWEYRRTCKTTSGYRCSFLYIGHYQLTSDGYSTSTKTLSLEECLLSCVSSSTCTVASYDGKLKCQHSTSEAVAGHKRTLSPGWSQYLKQNCSQSTAQKNIPVFYICLGVMSVVIVILICTIIFVIIHYRKKLSHLMTRNASSQNVDDLNRSAQGVFFSTNNSAKDELRGRDESTNLDCYIHPTPNYEEIRYSEETSTANIDSTDVKQTASDDDNLNRAKYSEDRDDNSQTMRSDTTHIKYRGSTDSTQCKH